MVTFKGIYVTEDFSSKSSRQVDQEKTWRNGPLAAVEPGMINLHRKFYVIYLEYFRDQL